MIQLLSRLFIKDHKNTDLPRVRQAYGILSGAVGIFLNIILFTGKLAAGMLSGSIAITADAFNNLSDAGSSVITLIGFKMSGQKPDPEHPFGHGRIEYISGLFVSVAVLIMAFELVKSSIGKLRSPEPVNSSPLVIAILCVSILVKMYMAYYNKSLSRKLDSAAMSATAADSLSDTVSTGVVLAATLVGRWTGILIDGWCGILVGLFIFYTGIQALRETMNPLLGQPPKEEFVKNIESLVTAHPMVKGIHDLIVHDYGPGRLMISLHAEVPANGNILQIHDEIDNIEKELQEKLNCSATIHMDPVVTDNVHINHLKAEVSRIIGQISPRLTMHDFRVVEGPTHSNLIFDLVIPHDFSMTEVDVVNRVKEQIRGLQGSYYAVIQVDHSYS
ncbi:cation diffusion facilitator family transporter [Blautia producta]|uniref:cation diffusion facilitator family transporter n=1 Tax=Blautia producta TaxID=33035 RepID=UPI0031B5D7C1